ncbi:MAG: hypothetical protein KGL39_30320 [Patescibacteria group bacterium]|nr:hypothetical protein [Patescibacteria group bacterium]
MTTEPYRPSNATEGEMFMDEFCARCSKCPSDADVRALVRAAHRLLRHAGIADAAPADIDGDDHLAESAVRAALRPFAALAEQETNDANDVQRTGRKNDAKRAGTVGVASGDVSGQEDLRGTEDCPHRGACLCVRPEDCIRYERIEEDRSALAEQSDTTRKDCRYACEAFPHCGCKIEAFAPPQPGEAPAAGAPAPSDNITQAADLILAGFRARGSYGPDPLRDMATHAAQILDSHRWLKSPMNVAGGPPRPKPTVEELEAILQRPDDHFKIESNPDGSIRADLTSKGVEFDLAALSSRIAALEADRAARAERDRRVRDAAAALNYLVPGDANVAIRDAVSALTAALGSDAP